MISRRQRNVQTVLVVAIVIFAIGLFLSVFNFYRTVSVSQTQREQYAQKIANMISTDDLNNKYFDGKKDKNAKNQMIQGIKDSLVENVPVADTVTYDGKEYKKDDVLNKLAMNIYKLQFQNMDLNVKKVESLNRSKTNVILTGPQLRITNFLALALNDVNENLRQQQGVGGLSQTQYSLAEYIFLNKNWSDYIKKFDVQGNEMKTSMVLRTVPDNKPYLTVDTEAARKMQTDFIK